MTKIVLVGPWKFDGQKNHATKDVKRSKTVQAVRAVQWKGLLEPKTVLLRGWRFAYIPCHQICGTEEVKKQSDSIYKELNCLVLLKTLTHDFEHICRDYGRYGLVITVVVLPPNVSNFVLGLVSHQLQLQVVFLI